MASLIQRRPIIDLTILNIFGAPSHWRIRSGRVRINVSFRVLITRIFGDLYHFTTISHEESEVRYIANFCKRIFQSWIQIRIRETGVFWVRTVNIDLNIFERGVGDQSWSKHMVAHWFWYGLSSYRFETNTGRRRPKRIKNATSLPPINPRTGAASVCFENTLGKRGSFLTRECECEERRKRRKETFYKKRWVKRLRWEKSGDLHCKDGWCFQNEKFCKGTRICPCIDKKLKQQPNTCRVCRESIRMIEWV